MEETVKSRLCSYLTYKHISKTAFCRVIGVSSSFVTSMRCSLKPDKLEKIAVSFPDLNRDWLLTGMGNMLLDTSHDIEVCNRSPFLSRLLLFIKNQGLNKNRFELDCGISRGYLSNVKGEVGASVLLKIFNAYPSLNKDWILTGNGPMLISSDTPLSDSHVQDVSGSGINITTVPSSSISIEQSKQITLLIEENIKQGARIDRLISLLERNK